MAKGRTIKPSQDQDEEVIHIVDEIPATQEIVDLINQVCGLDEQWARACIYYCMATHKLKAINWMPVLAILASPGSGKSWLLRVLKRLCYQPYDIVCSAKMTAASLRNELVKARSRTAVIEEADLYPNRKELESYLINRVSKKTTSSLSVTQQVTTDSGAHRWRTGNVYVFGATIIHDRRELDDLATQRRAITVPIKHVKDKKFLEPSEAQLSELSLPKGNIQLGDIPSTFDNPKTSGSGLATWSPLIRIADGLDDSDWLDWAVKRVAEANESLVEGGQWEFGMCVFRSLVASYFNGKPQVIPLSAVTDLVVKEYAGAAPKTISTTLRKMGFDAHSQAGTSCIFTGISQIKKVAKEIGYEDEALTDVKNEKKG